MIILNPPCETCGSMDMPTEVACDKCDSVQTIAEFKGIVISFDESDDKFEEEDDGSLSMIEQSEFHFCSMKCLADYISDPEQCGKIMEHEDKDINIYSSSRDTAALLYALGRSGW
jgi:uncharacterized OB-fold protein